MNVQKIVEYPEQGIVIFYDEHGKFLALKDSSDIIDLDEDEQTVPLLPEKVEA